jgi:hypothetical protein
MNVVGQAVHVSVELLMYLPPSQADTGLHCSLKMPPINMDWKLVRQSPHTQFPMAVLFKALHGVHCSA